MCLIQVVMKICYLRDPRCPLVALFPWHTYVIYVNGNLGLGGIHVFMHYENTPIQIYWKFHTPSPPPTHKKKNWKFSDKNSDMFSYFCSKHRLWVLVRTASVRRFYRGGSNEYPQFMFLSRNKKNNVYPCKPQFYYIKVGFKRIKII